MYQPRVSYAQNFEDIYLDWLLGGKKDGFYVDVGASHPVVDSVTKYFYDRGWSGLNLEPIKHHYEALQKQRPRDITVNVGVANEKSTLTFREYPGGDGLSTFSKSMQQEYVGERKHKEYKVSVRPLADILEEYNIGEIDFLKVDVEGFEYDVLNSNDWKRFKPKVVIIEANHIMKDWHPIIDEAGYVKVFYDGLNEYFMDKSLVTKGLYAAYVPSIIGAPYLKYPEHQLFTEYEKNAKQNKEQIDSLQATLAGVHFELDATQRTLNGPLPLLFRHAAKRVVKGSIKRAMRLLGVSESGRKYKNPKALVPTTNNTEDTKQLFLAGKQADLNNFLHSQDSWLKAKAYKLLKLIYRYILKLMEFGKRVLRKIKRTIRGFM